MEPKDNNLKAEYYSVWKIMLSQMLGWTEEETADWASRYDCFLDNPDDMIYHAEPPYWAITPLVPADLDANLQPNERTLLYQELHAVFHDESALTLAADWKSYKAQVESIIASYRTLKPD